jgi:hypothetical protein
MRNLLTVFSRLARNTPILALLSFPLAATANNLLVNGDFSAQNTGFSSGYSFVASGQSTLVGSYGIRTMSTDFNTGYAAFGDHTTGSGYMLLLDGAPSSSTIAWSETVAVQTNQSYYFSAWLTSSDSTSPATVRFGINGTQVGSDLTLSSAAGQWQNFNLVWNSTTNTNALITIADENTINVGNDFALDDLSFDTNNLAAVTASIYTAVEIDWPSQANASYQVQYSTALDTNTWIDLGTPVAGNGTTNVFFDSIRGTSSRIYRIQTLP